MTIQNHIKNNEDIFNRGLDFVVTPISQLPSYAKKNIKKYIKMGFINQNFNNLDLIARYQSEIKSYQSEITILNSIIYSLESPKSWKITAPLRKAMHSFRSFVNSTKK